MPKNKAKKQEESLRKYVFKPTITISSKDLLEMPRHDMYPMMEDESGFDKDEMKGRFEIDEVKTK